MPRRRSPLEPDYTGYPRYDYDGQGGEDHRLRREPHDDDALRALGRSTRPSRNNNPILTLRPSSRDRERELNRNSLPPEDRADVYDSFLDPSANPPPRSRRSTRGIPTFNDQFGDLQRPAPGSNEDMNWAPEDPARDPLRRTRPSGAPQLPYGGGSPPNDPFRLGGDLYNYQQAVGERHPALSPPDRPDWDDQARRRDDHYRRRIPQSWGLAQHREYEARRRHEERMRGEQDRGRSGSRSREDRGSGGSSRGSRGRGRDCEDDYWMDEDRR